MSAGPAQRDRSPAYPVIPLKEALDRLAEFERHFKRQAAPPERAGDAWGVKAKAYTDRTIAALRYFGLFDYQGQGSARVVAISDLGRTYLRAQQGETRREVIQAAALRPKQIAKYWNRWGADRPPDGACLDDLVLNNGFSPNGAKDFIRIYDETIGLLMAAQFDRIDALKTSFSPRDEDAVWDEAADAQREPPAAGRPSPSTPSEAPTEEERFVTDEGAVIIRFPQDLGLASIEDLDEFLALFLKKARRRAERQQERAEKSSGSAQADG